MIRYITLPLIRNTIMIMVLLAVGRIYGDFGMIYGIVEDNSVLYPFTDVIDTYSYRALRLLNNFSMSSAVALYQTFVGVITVSIFNAIAKKVDPDTRLF